MTATWPITLISSCRRHCSIGRTSIGPLTAIPALLTSASSRGADALRGGRDVSLRRDVEPYRLQTRRCVGLALAHAGEDLEAALARGGGRTRGRCRSTCR